MPNPRSARTVTALPIIDLQTEARILAYHTGRESGEASMQQSHVGAREVQDELETDLWTALQQGAV